MRDNFIKNNLAYLLAAIVMAVSFTLSAGVYWKNEQLQQDHTKFVDEVSDLLDGFRKASEFCESHKTYLSIRAKMVDGKSEVEVECRP